MPNVQIPSLCYAQETLALGDVVYYYKLFVPFDSLYNIINNSVAGFKYQN